METRGRCDLRLLKILFKSEGNYVTVTWSCPTCPLRGRLLSGDRSRQMYSKAEKTAREVAAKRHAVEGR